MTAYNIVRFKVKRGRESDFVALHERMNASMKGLRRASVVKTGDRAYCFVGEWNAMSDIVNARADMIANLDQMRDMLEDMGGGLGLTDPVSGEVVVDLKP